MLKVRGFVTAKISGEGLRTNETVYILAGLQKSLVGRPAIQALELVFQIRTAGTTSHNQSVIEKFPELFSGLGAIDSGYLIKLKSDANPFVLSTPRRIAIPLQRKVKTDSELQSMECFGGD